MDCRPVDCTCMDPTAHMSAAAYLAPALAGILWAASRWLDRQSPSEPTAAVKSERAAALAEDHPTHPVFSPRLVPEVCDCGRNLGHLPAVSTNTLVGCSGVPPLTF